MTPIHLELLIILDHFTSLNVDMYLFMNTNNLETGHSLRFNSTFYFESSDY